MADLRQKQIVDTILETLKAGIGAEFQHVAMLYGFPLPEELYQDQVAVEVMPGEEINLQEIEAQSFSKVDLMYEFSLVLHHAGTRSTTTNESSVFAILCEAFKKCYALIMADHTQGLSFVTNTRWAGAGAPDIDGGELIYGKIMLNFQIFYRHSHTDASA